MSPTVVIDFFFLLYIYTFYKTFFFFFYTLRSVGILKMVNRFRTRRLLFLIIAKGVRNFDAFNRVIKSILRPNYFSILRPSTVFHCFRRRLSVRRRRRSLYTKRLDNIDISTAQSTLGSLIRTHSTRKGHARND